MLAQWLMIFPNHFIASSLIHKRDLAMPSTINGIGTAYYGKKNREEYQGMCEYCGRPGVMQNYETRLWFSFLFIPVIPLGRKQILDYCSSCTRHKALNVADWERIKTEAIQQSGDQLAENQNDPEAAVNMHLTLAAFHKNEEAGRLADIMREKFGDDAQVQLYLAGWYEGQGKTEQMRATIDRAWALDPDSPAVRRAVGMTQIEDGQIEKARETLKVLEPPSPNYNASVFYTLAKGYQKAQEHAQALEIFQMILEATPKAADEKEFRAAVRESEKTLARPKSILPAKSPISGTAIGWTAVLLLVAAGIGFWNYYISTHRTLYVVNGLSAPITVEITNADNQPVHSVKVDPNVGWAVKIPEGTYHAQVTTPKAIAPGSEPVDFTIASGWWERFFREPAYVIDPSRSAFLIWQETTYSAKPQNGNLGGESFALHIAQPFTTYADVDFLFQPFPAEVKVSDRTREVKKTRVGLEVVTPAYLPQQNFDQHTLEEWLGYLERHMSVSPTDHMLLGSYTLLASQHDQWDRCLKFLRSRLGDRPVNVEWHRAYQQSSELAGQADGLAAEYDDYLKQDPNNSNMLYLRGRLCGRVSETLAYLDRAIAQDDKNKWRSSQKAIRCLRKAGLTKRKPRPKRPASSIPTTPPLRISIFKSAWRPAILRGWSRSCNRPPGEKVRPAKTVGGRRCSRSAREAEGSSKSLRRHQPTFAAGISAGVRCERHQPQSAVPAVARSIRPGRGRGPSAAGRGTVRFDAVRGVRIKRPPGGSLQAKHESPGLDAGGLLPVVHEPRLSATGGQAKRGNLEKAGHRSLECHGRIGTLSRGVAPESQDHVSHG